jgi:hypothetical protein
VTGIAAPAARTIPAFRPTRAVRLTPVTIALSARRETAAQRFHRVFIVAALDRGGVKADSRFVPYLTAVVIGATAGVLARSPVVAGAAACVVSAVWAFYETHST